MHQLWYSIGQAAQLLGVAVVTLRRWTKNHNIVFERTCGGHRHFRHDVLFPTQNEGVTVLYARVSSRDQKEDLKRQVHVLEEHVTSQA